MLSLDLVLAQSQAYAAGNSVGLIVRTVVLGAITFAVLRRLSRGQYGTGIRNSQAGTIVGLLAAGGLFLFSVTQLLDRGTAVVTDPAYAQGKVELRAGCLASGAPKSYCECLTSELDVHVPAASRGDFSARMETAGGDMTRVPELQSSVDVCLKRLTAG